jgi:DNA helicase II / ATP-dependent DNA helicase PcrA
MTAAPFKPSPQQAAFYSWIKTGTGSAIVRAVAGAGKTTTLIVGLELMEGLIFFGAYNKEIANEIQRRAPQKPGLTISTMHAAGFRAWGGACREKLKVDGNKCRDIYRDACSRHPGYVPFEGAVLALVSYAKQAALGVLKPLGDNAAWLDLIDHFNIDTLEEDALVIKLAKKVMQKSYELDTSIVDYDDMIYAPLVHKVRLPSYDWVLIDEAQDTNASRRALALGMLKRGGRLVAVGDEHQAIYGFTGADADALNLIQVAVNAIELPLTVTYRCPKAVVRVAHQYVNHIEAHESAPEGQVEELTAQAFMGKVKPGDAVLCRFNAPNIRLAFALIAAGVPARVEGRDIGAGLKKLARRWKSPTFDALMSNLDAYEEREVAKYRAKEQESRAAAVEDTVNCLKVVIGRAIQTESNLSPVEQVCAEVDKIFGTEDSKTPVVLLSSIHKSKGREWHNVFWLQAGPSKWARKQWELDQEVNLNYVACTRAQSYLGLVEMPPENLKKEQA